MNELFRKIAHGVSRVTGSPWAFIVAFLSIVAWALSGQFFGYSNTWQLVINTSTTILTFLMVFLIQNTQNRDAKATQLKLDELIKAIRGARNNLISIEEDTDDTIKKLEKEFQSMHKKAESRHDQRSHTAGSSGHVEE